MTGATVPAPGQRTRQVGGDFAATALGVVLRSALALLISVVTARALLPADMGRYAFLLWLAGVLPIVLSLGIPTAITRFTAEAMGGGRPSSAGALVVRFVRTQAALSVAAGGLVAGAALLPGVSPGWTLPLVLTAACVPLLVLHGSAGALLAGLQRFRRPAALGVAQLALQAALLVPVALVAPGLSAFLTVHLAVNVVAFGALAVLAWRTARAAHVFPAGSQAAGLDAGVRRYAGSVSLLVILDAVVWQRTEVAFLQALSTPAQVAFYALAFGIASQVSRLPYQASVVLFPEFPRLVGAGRTDEVAALHVTAMRYLALIGAPLGIGLAALAPFLVHLLYGERYAPAGVVLAVLALGSLPAYLAGASPGVLHATGRENVLVRQAAAAAAVNLALALALVPVAGAPGAALANVLAQALGSALAVRAALREVGGRVPVAALARIAAAALLMGMAAATTVSVLGGLPGLVGAVIVGAIVYALALRALGALTAEDLDRARVVLERLPASARAGGLAVAGFLCRHPVPEPWSPSR